MVTKKRKKKPAPPAPVSTPPRAEPLPRGRPTKLTAELVLQIARAIRAGSYIEEAAESLGVSRSVVYHWLDEGRQGKSELHRDFLDTVERARAEDAVRDLALISQAAQRPVGDIDWRAAAWKRERKDPSKWGQKVRITLTEELEGFLDDLARILPAEWYEKALEAAAARLGSAAPHGAEGSAGSGGAVDVAVAPSSPAG